MNVNTSVNLENLQSVGVAPGQVDVQKTGEVLAAVLSGENVRVMTSGAGAPKSIVGVTEEIPVLDEVDVDEDGKEINASLIALCSLETDEILLEGAMKWLQHHVDKLKKDTKDTEELIDKTVKDSIEQDKKKHSNKICSWILTTLSFVAAIVTSVATFGAAAPASAVMIVGAVSSCIGAGVGMTTMILDATGATESIIRKIAEAYKEDNPELSEQDALQKAQKVWSISLMAVNVCLTVTSLTCAVQILRSGGALTQTISRGMRIAQAALGVVGQIGGAVQTGFAFSMVFSARDADKRKVMLDYMMKFIDMIKQKIEEDQQFVEKLISDIEDIYSGIKRLATSGEENMQLMMKNFNQTI